MQQFHNYYTLERPTNSFWYYFFFILKLPFSIPTWILSFFLARNLTNIALNPTQVKTQKPLHIVPLSDDINDPSAVIVNIHPHEFLKVFKDYLLKIRSVLGFSLVETHSQSYLVYDDPKDREYIDKVVEELKLLLEGKLDVDNLKNKKFKWSDIHLKGLERLDSKLRDYLFEKLYHEFGVEEVDTPQSIKLDFYSLEIPNNAILDSVEVSTEQEKQKPFSERKYIIACMARDQNYINWIKDFNKSANQIGCTVIGFNYRGIDYSRGMVWTQDNMVDDTLAQVQRLLDLGVKPENIGIEGMCLGGAVATLAAAQLHDKGIKVKLYNERSFRSLPRLVVGYIIPGANSNPWNPLNWFRYALAAVAYALITPLMWIVGWHMDAASAWDRIPVEDKDYSVVRRYKESTLVQDDGVIEDGFSSLASYVDEHRDEVKQKIENTEHLTEQEAILLHDKKETHEFSLAPNYSEKTLPHFVARRYLNNSQECMTMHDHMIGSFQQKFNSSRNKKESNGNFVNQRITKDSDAIRRPLCIANNGGAGHIMALMGVLNELEKDKEIKLIRSKHKAVLYEDKPSTFIGVMLRVGVYLMSVWGLGYVIGLISRFFGFPRLPDHKEFWVELNKVNDSQKNTVDSDNPQGRERDYVDMLLDVYPIGYESVAINNTLHRMDKIDDIHLLLGHKDTSEKVHYEVAFDFFLKKLVDAAEAGTPYTEIISTQSLSMTAICDAARYYNENYKPQKPILIHQFITDLPSRGCEHFLGNLESLTSEQRQVMHVYAVNLTRGVVKSFLDDGKYFNGVTNISPQHNPMIRPGFKNKSLEKYLDWDQDHTLEFKSYVKDSAGQFIPKNEKEKVFIPGGAKVAFILLSSTASLATVDYVKALLASKDDYEKVFVFGGLNDNIYQPIEDIIREYPLSEQEKIRKRIVRLGNQGDEEMGPIMTRSNCAFIRGGGMSIMEQMALPVHKNKAIFLHNIEKDNQPLTSGLPWEDGNADGLISFMKSKQRFVKKTSPNRIANDLDALDFKSITESVTETVINSESGLKSSSEPDLKEEPIRSAFEKRRSQLKKQPSKVSFCRYGLLASNNTVGNHLDSSLIKTPVIVV